MRSRSRFSPANKIEKEDLCISKSTTNLKRTSIVRSQAKTRYHLPSSAKSLPSLAVASRDKPKSLNEKQNPEKENLNPIKKSFGKYIEECAKKDQLKKEELAKKAPKEDEDKTKGVLLQSTDEKILTTNDVEKTTTTDRDDVGKNSLIDQDDEDNQFDEEIKRNKEAEEKLQMEIKELESSEIEVIDVII